MADVYRDDAALLKDFNRLSQEYRNKAGRYIKNLLKLQRAESGLRGKISMVEFEQRRAAKKMEQDGEPVVHCSFCGRSQLESETMIAADKIYICDSCVRLCASIIDDKEINTAPEDGDTT